MNHTKNLAGVGGVFRVKNINIIQNIFREVTIIK
jgi:hypothetical protein